MTRILLSLALCFVSAFAAANSPAITQKISLHTLEFQKAPSAVKGRAKLALVIELKTDGPSPLKPALVAAIGTDKLSRGGVPSHWDKNFLVDFEAGADASKLERRLVKMELRNLTAPHLLLAVQIELNRETQRYEMSAELAAHQFQSRKGEPLTFQSVVLWSSQLSAGDSLERADLEPRLAQWLRRELGNFSSRYAKLNFEPAFESPAPVQARYTPPQPRAGTLGVRLFEYQLGFSFGTPAVGNLHAGLWGSEPLPFAFQVSGMFWGREQRALQTELLWLHDAKGAFQQGVGAALVLFNEHVNERVETSPGVFQNTTIDRLKPYLGPVYVVNWKNFRAELGVSFRLGSGQDTAVRPLFQIGYTPNL